VSPWDLIKPDDLKPWVPPDERPLDDTDIEWMKRAVDDAPEAPFLANRDLGDENVV
jgi:hypothetical protein